ncbi:hypothetical protein DRJ17_01250 [Candidatus Woesearchaeota archaeon]|nr:MAG: hypothetical protein DRJ17_01250 [Candidatus Woesearchaeota archaeon]
MVEVFANVFVQMGIIIIVATLGGYLSRLLKQPLIPLYILIGVLLGPELGSRLGAMLGINFAGLITNQALIQDLAMFGIAFLLFIVGLEMNIKKLKNIGHISIIGTPIQVALMFIFGFVITTAFLGKFFPGTRDAIYIGLVLAFSSTVVVIKLLADRRELDTLHGRIAIGILIVQDIIAILAITFLSAIGVTSIVKLILTLLGAVALIVIALLLGKYVFPKIFNFAAKSEELLLLSSLAVLFVFVFLFNAIGFSIAIGAFVAGLALANLPYNYEVIGKVKSIKDFFATIFFVALGMQFSLIGINTSVWIPLLILFVMIVIAKPIIFMFLGAFFGYTERTLFLFSFSLGQVSEFSLIIVSLGVLELKQASTALLSVTIVLAIATIAFTSYFIKFEDKIYRFLKPRFKIFSRTTADLEYLPAKYEYDIIQIGYDRIGYSILKTLQDKKDRVLICDFNPEIIKKLIVQKIPCIYGDAADEEILKRLHLNKAKLVISTSPNFDDNVIIIRKTKAANKRAHVFVTANTVDEALELYRHGADYVIIPHFLGGEKVSSILEQASKNYRKFRSLKKEHVAHLKERLKMGHRNTLKNHR